MTYPQHKAVKQMIDLAGGSHQAAHALQMNKRNMERFYGGGRAPSDSLLSAMADYAETLLDNSDLARKLEPIL